MYILLHNYGFIHNCKSLWNRVREKLHTHQCLYEPSSQHNIHCKLLISGKIFQKYHRVHSKSEFLLHVKDWRTIINQKLLCTWGKCFFFHPSDEFIPAECARNTNEPRISHLSQMCLHLFCHLQSVKTAFLEMLFITCIQIILHNFKRVPIP